jgi:hypothetical protein
VVNVDDLGSTLGVHLRSISVEMTDDAVTPIDIERQLPFLGKLREGRPGYWGYGGVFSRLPSLLRDALNWTGYLRLHPLPK